VGSPVVFIPFSLHCMAVRNVHLFPPFFPLSSPSLCRILARYLHPFFFLWFVPGAGVKASFNAFPFPLFFFHWEKSGAAESSTTFFLFFFPLRSKLRHTSLLCSFFSPFLCFVAAALIPPSADQKNEAAFAYLGSWNSYTRRRLRMRTQNASSPPPFLSLEIVEKMAHAFTPFFLSGPAIQSPAGLFFSLSPSSSRDHKTAKTGPFLFASLPSPSP